MTSDFSTETGEILDYPIRSAFQNFFTDYSVHNSVSSQQLKAARLISRCKTGELGYSIDYCPECGYEKIHYRSCNNRDCPSCQAPQEKKWVMQRNSELIDGIAYYHVIFTLPEELNSLIYCNQKLLYNLLFKAASDTLLTLCKDKKYMGATPGIISVLHTWGQKLNYHPHLHICLSGGGLNRAGYFITTKHKSFIIPVKVIGKLFKGKYMSALKDLHANDLLVFKGTCASLTSSYSWKEFINLLYKKDWCPFVKETFNGNGNAVEYLARYAYRTAIANSRIVNVTGDHVTFKYTDYADNHAKKLMTISGEEFIRRFLMHILPPGFHRVRFSGYLAGCIKVKMLTHINRSRGCIYVGDPTKGKSMMQLLNMIYGIDICHCPKCKHMLGHHNYIRAPDIAFN